MSEQSIIHADGRRGIVVEEPTLSTSYAVHVIPAGALLEVIQ